MILFKHYGALSEAYIEKGLLEENGINCVVIEDALTSIYPAPDAMAERISLYIDADKLEQAQTILCGE